MKKHIALLGLLALVASEKLTAKYKKVVSLSSDQKAAEKGTESDFKKIMYFRAMNIKAKNYSQMTEDEQSDRQVPTELPSALVYAAEDVNDAIENFMTALGQSLNDRDNAAFTEVWHKKYNK